MLNPTTGLISPQFHVVFDDDFTTVPHLRRGTVPPNWADLVHHSSERTTSEFYDLTKTWFQSQSDETAGEILKNPTSPLAHDATTPLENEGDTTSANEGASMTPATSEPSHDHKGDDALHMPSMINLEMAGLRRSPRLQEKASKERNPMSFTSILMTLCTIGITLVTHLHPSVAISSGEEAINSFVHRCNIVNANFDGTLNAIPHIVLASGKENNECYTFKDMLAQPDKKEFLEAMLKETAEHESRGHWSVVLRSTMPADEKPIQAIWSFKRKRFPDGSLNKHKARLCAHGGMQQWGINYWETYAPVVNWISVRFLLIMSEILGLETQAIDFVLAFPQAKLNVPVYMYVPAGMQLHGIPNDAHHMYILKLEKSLYGLKQASANWYDMLKKALENCGLQESVADACVFFKKDMIVLVYVDDCILISNQASIIQDFIKSLEDGPETSYSLTKGS